jgi:antitoxin CcdA
VNGCGERDRRGQAILLWFAREQKGQEMGERVTVEIDPDVLDAAREAGVDLSELLTQALRRRLPKLNASDRAEDARRWYEENKEAVDAYNKLIEEKGLFSDGMRTF